MSAGVAIAGIARVVGPIGNAIGIAKAVASLGVQGSAAYRGPISHGLTPWEIIRALGRGGSPEEEPGDLFPSVEISGVGMSSRAGSPSGEVVRGSVEVPSPRGVGLLTDFIPFDGRSLESSIDRYLERFEDLGVGLSRSAKVTDLIAELMAAAVVLAASTLVLEMLGRSSDDEAALAGASLIAGFDGDPGLPGPWSLEEC